MPTTPTNNHLWPAGDVPDIAWTYWSLVDAMRKNPGMYGLDAHRTELHERLCEIYGLTREVTLAVTDHMDRFETAVDFDIAMRKLKVPHAIGRAKGSANTDHRGRKEVLDNV